MGGTTDMMLPVPLSHYLAVSAILLVMLSLIHI